MTTQELKNSILELAVEGKLVQVGGKDGLKETGSQLLEKIRAEKAKLIKDGKLKKDKPLPPITDDEIPCLPSGKAFEIPKNWCWCRLGEIITFLGGYAFKSTDFIQNSNNQVIRLGNVKDNLLITEEKQVFINDKIALQAQSFKIIPNDILVSMTGTRGKGDYFFTVHIDESNLTRRFYINQRVGCLRTYEKIDSKWLCNILQSRFIRTSIFEHETGTANQGNIGSEDIKKLLIPLPPLAEQKRIVAKIEDLLPYIQKYDAAHTKLQALNKQFPIALQKSILQEAIQGRLLTNPSLNTSFGLPGKGPSCPQADTAKTRGKNFQTGLELLEEIRKERARLIKDGKLKKDKPLPPITDDEIPFEIPENWCWCRLGDVVKIQSSKRVFEKDYVTSGIPFFRSKEIGDLSRGENIKTELFITKEHYNELKNNYGVPQKGDILLTSVGSIGNSWICDGREFYYKDGNVTQICKNKHINTNFINLFLQSHLFWKQVNESVSGTAYNALTIIKLNALLFPLPPLAEQKRIVAKIEELLPLCKRLSEEME